MKESHMTVILIFVLTALISFAGSIHIGPVNLMVIRTSLQNDYKQALLVAFGGSLPELLYAAVAVGCLTFLNQHPAILLVLNRLVVPFFIIMGIMSLWPKKKLQQARATTGGDQVTTGLLLALFNPQLLPFWLGTLIYLHSFLPFHTIFEQTAFTLGTAAGAFGLLSLYAWLATYKKAQLNAWLSRFDFDKLTGITFIGMGIFKMLFTAPFA